MSEKITRAQADAALEELEDLAVCGHNEEAASRHTIRNIASMVRAYLAQQPSDDVVRKAHEALWLADELLTEIVAAYRREGRLGDQHAKLVVGYVAAIRAALPTMPEEK